MSSLWERFWEWVASWAVVITKPSDLGYSDVGFELPPKHTTEIIVKTDQQFVHDDGTISMFAIEAQTLLERRDARRLSLNERVKSAVSLMENDPDAQWLYWCDLNIESETATMITRIRIIFFVLFKFSHKLISICFLE